MEAAFEQYLRGTDGKRVISTNSDGKITGEYYEVEPEPSAAVGTMTINLELQQVVENALAKTVEKMNAEDGTKKAGARRGRGEGRYRRGAVPRLLPHL